MYRYGSCFKHIGISKGFNIETFDISYNCVDMANKSTHSKTNCTKYIVLLHVYARLGLKLAHPPPPSEFPWYASVSVSKLAQPPPPIPSTPTPLFWRRHSRTSAARKNITPATNIHSYRIISLPPVF